MRSLQRSLLALALVPTSLYLAASAMAAPAISEFSLPSGFHAPFGIVAGPDGNLWFTEKEAPYIGVSTVDGSMVQYAGLHNPAQGITVGADGNLWVTEPGGAYIARVTPKGAITEFSLVAGSNPTGITAGPDGNLWFTETGANSAIGRITPSGVVRLFTAGLTHNGNPNGITAGPDGNLWFTESNNPGAIGRITPSGVITQFTAGLTVNSDPTAITAGPDGNLWFTESNNPGAIGRITPSGVITQFTAGLTVNSDPSAITAGPDGNLWFTEANAPGAIGEITTAGVISQLATPTTNSQPEGIATGPDGNLWFTEQVNQGQLGRVTGVAVAVTSPTVTTGTATGIGETTATLTGIASPNGGSATYHFDWGATTAYGEQAPAVDAVLGSGNSDHTVFQLVTGLLPDTVYHYRLVATNCGGCQAGTSYGEDMSFVTGSVLGPGSPFGASVSPPVLGETAVASKQSGSVLVKPPGSKTFLPLLTGEDIPIGSVINATYGTLRLTTALNRHGRTQSATVWGGTFSVHQTSSSGMTTFVLSGPLACSAHAAHVVAGDARSHKPPRTHSLWAKDNHGQYSTRGQNSVATVRGTVWETVQTCNGTRTFVKKGVVSVRNLHTHRTVLVKSGHSYLAKP